MEEILITAGFALVLCAIEVAVFRWVQSRYVTAEAYESLRETVVAVCERLALMEGVVGYDRENPLPDRVARLEGAVEDISRYDLGTLRERVTHMEAKAEALETEDD